MRVGHQNYYKIKYVPISPIHIGTGEEIEPLDYTIKGNMFYKIDFSKFVSYLKDDKREELIKKSKKPSVRTIMEVRTFIRDNFEPEKMKDCIIENFPISRSIYEKFNKLLDELANKDPKNQQINQLSIMKIYRNGNEPIIPGSSIKGAIRTAIVDKLLKNDSNKSSKLKKFFSGTNDPFSSVRVSDTFRDNYTVEVGFFVNMPIDNFNKECIKDGLSVLAEFISIGKVYYGDIRITNEPTDKPFYSELKLLTNDINTIFKICNEHYLPILNREINLLKKNDKEHKFLPIVEKYYNEIKENKVGLLRVGRHSGAEAVTIEGREIEIKTKDGYRKDTKSTTTWYFSSEDPKVLNSLDKLLPCGWVIVKKGDD